MIMKKAVRHLFERYARMFERGLAGDVDAAEVADIYASGFLASTPAGVVVGENDDILLEAMKTGYVRNREIGTRAMRLRDIRMSDIDDLHCVAHVAWTAVYARDDLPETEVEFEVHYLVRVDDGVARVFGWMSGDEDALLKSRGIL
jgi:hypothetical protein